MLAKNFMQRNQSDEKKLKLERSASNEIESVGISCNSKRPSHWPRGQVAIALAKATKIVHI
jgi:hypothetical protein